MGVADDRLSASRHWAPTIPFHGVGLAAYPALDALVVLNTAASGIWDALRRGAGLDGAVNACAEALGLPPDEVAPHTRACIAQWRRGGLLAEPSLEGAIPPDVHAHGQPFAIDADYAMLGTSVRLQVEASETVASLTDQLRELRSDRSVPAHRLELRRTAQGFVLIEDGVARQPIEDSLHARGALLAALTRAAIPDDGLLGRIHAACVTAERGTVLLPAPGGSGKSTLTASLLATGWQLVSDDVTMVTRDGMAVPSPLPLGLKSGSWPLLAECFPELAARPEHRLGPRRVKYLIPDPRSRAPRPLPIDLLICPRFRPGAVPTLRALDRLEALSMVASEQSWLNLEPEPFQAFLTWLDAVPAFAIEYGTSAQAIDLIEQALETRRG